MNVAYLDPPYSRYFQELSAHLRQRTGGSSVALLSSPAYRMYCGGERSLVWNGGEIEPGCAVPSAFARAEWAQTAPERFARVLAHAVEWFKVRFRDEKINVCLAYSDARPFSLAAHIAAQQSGVVCVYFERGAFRYRSASLSTQGLNARFDISAARRQQGITGMSEADLGALRPAEPWLRLRFAVFLVRNALACAINEKRRPMQYRRVDVVDYARIAFNQFLSKLRFPSGPDDALLNRTPHGTPAPAVLLALQLQADSQFVMHSPFRSNQELIDFVVPRIVAEMPGAEVLVRKHPMDTGAYRVPAGARQFNGDLHRCYERTQMLICVNSTVGFEAATLGKTVLCFGEGFYTRDPHIVNVTPDTFSAQLRTALLRCDDPAAGQALKAEVLRYYQSPGDVWAYTNEDLQATAAIVLQHVRADVSTSHRMI
jgi:capsular polysaccharide export protein